MHKHVWQTMRMDSGDETLAHCTDPECEVELHYQLATRLLNGETVPTQEVAHFNRYLLRGVEVWLMEVSDE